MAYYIPNQIILTDSNTATLAAQSIWVQVPLTQGR